MAVSAEARDAPAGKLLKLDSAGVILQTVTVGAFPEFPVFDGTNIWVPSNGAGSVSVVRASSVLKTYQPQDQSAWGDAYGRFRELIEMPV